ncbi:hypothetical protein H0H93_013941 [Arthromyces matolae]|nr:hypothetical protein H0H93_013941 [Arthromyces matolae]
MPALPWPWNSKTPNPSTTQSPELLQSNDDANDIHERQITRLGAIPPRLLALTSFALGASTALTTVFLYTKYGQRIRNSDWVAADMFKQRRWIRGVVTSVGDADNFRLYHTPFIGYRWPLKFRKIPTTAKELKDETLHIRIAGVDAPEGAHFGRPAQPYFEESFAWLRNKVMGKTVYCQVLRRDQYSRIVANVNLAPRILPGSLFTGPVLALEMIRAGWGTIYEQAGAEYGNTGKEAFLRTEAEAKAARRGMWAKGVKGETPAEYKRRHAAASSPEEAEASRSKASPSSVNASANKKSWLRRWLGR